MAYMSGCELITRNRCYYPNEKRCLLSGESGLTDSLVPALVAAVLSFARGDLFVARKVN